MSDAERAYNEHFLPLSFMERMEFNCLFRASDIGHMDLTGINQCEVATEKFVDLLCEYAIGRGASPRNELWNRYE